MKGAVELAGKAAVGFTLQAGKTGASYEVINIESMFKGQFKTTFLYKKVIDKMA